MPSEPANELSRVTLFFIIRWQMKTFLPSATSMIENGIQFICRLLLPPVKESRAVLHLIWLTDCIKLKRQIKLKLTPFYCLHLRNVIVVSSGFHYKTTQAQGAYITRLNKVLFHIGIFVSGGYLSLHAN